MTFPVEQKYTISAGFTDPRPLSNPGKRIHGAIDIAVPIGTVIIAPEPGLAYYLLNTRYPLGKGARDIYWSDRTWFAFSNYFYDVFGCLILIEGKTHTHVFAHIEPETINNIMNLENINRNWYIEDGKIAVANLDDGFPVTEGDFIGYSGNAGYSTGPHIHYEIHRGRRWDKWERRINPETLYKL